MDLKTLIPGKENSEHQPRLLYYYGRAILSSNFTVLCSDSLPFLGSPIRKGDILRANTLETLIFFFPLSLFPLIYFSLQITVSLRKTKQNEIKKGPLLYLLAARSLLSFCFVDWSGICSLRLSRF